MTSLLPFATQLDFPTGALEPSADTLTRRLSEMAGAYADQDAAAALVAAGDPVIYRAYTAAVPEERTQLVYRTTIVYPGDVGGEYFMTKGHHHHIDSAEFYLGMSGSGLMVMQSRSGEWRVEELTPYRAVYTPPAWAHRTVNTGKEELVFLAVYFGDAGHDYATIERDGFSLRVMQSANGPSTISA